RDLKTGALTQLTRTDAPESRPQWGRDGTLVFVEVRRRRSVAHGGAAASISWAKRERIVRAAQHFLLRLPSPPPCRFDVVAIDGDRLEWLRAAF
ncbi:YraN family protein, partial [Escherichia coli]|nr:YraN family protein [Escherichia coli]